METDRYVIRSFRVVVSLLLCVALLVSCVDETPFGRGSAGVKGTPVKVSLSLSVPPLGTPVASTATRSTRDKVGEDRSLGINLLASDSSLMNVSTRAGTNKPLYNLWVLQFSATGDKGLVKASKISNTPEPVKEKITIDADLVVGENQILYLVALGKQYDAISLATVKNVMELENYSLPSVRYVDGVAQSIIQNEEDIPYMGSQTGIDIVEINEGGRGYVKYDSDLGFTGGISMRAMVSKVTFNFSYSAAGYTPSMMTLNNVPTSFCINPPDDYKPTGFASLPAVLFGPDDFTNKQRSETIWYMAPNRQGAVSACDTQNKRYFYTKAGIEEGNAPHDGTYINLWAEKTANSFAMYYIFLGSNTTTDFNVNPHVHYIMRSDVNTTPNDNDKRVIDSGEIKMDIDFHMAALGRTNATSAMSKAKINSFYDVDASPGRRPIEVTALRCTLKVEILDSDQSSIPMGGESWLHLSTSPNYTEARSRELSGDQSALTTSLSIKNDIPGMLRLYLYNDEYLEYASIDPNSLEMTNKKRQAYVRFTFVDEAAKETFYTYRVDQRCAFYVGQLGGTRNADGSYPAGLVMGEKFHTFGEDYLSYHTRYTGVNIQHLKVGVYDNASYVDLSGEFAVDCRTTGKNATRYYATQLSAENEYGGFSTISIPGNPSILAPRKVNGKIDLYQYQGKYNSKEGFANRWCYDKNRDNNGNGVIDDDEMVWYLPSYDQILAFGLNFYGTSYASQTRDMFGTYLLSSTFFQKDICYFPLPYRPTQLIDLTTGADVRCVRDVPVPVNIKHGSTDEFTSGKVYEESGYAVIDASGLAKDTRAIKIKGGEYLTPEGRNKRHIDQNGYVNTVITSERFRVAPHDIDSMGKVAAVAITWALASGYNSAVNSLDINEESGVAERGCFVYGGKGGTDPNGTWRLPNLNELILIDMLEDVLYETASTTGFQKLFNDRRYWSATENNGNNGKTNAWTLTGEYTSGTKSRKYMASGAKTGTSRVRCIQDLP